MEKEEKLQEMSFRNYYSELTDDKKEEIRNAILSESGMSYPTFYYKLRNNSFKPLEIKMINEIIKSSSNNVNPEKRNGHLYKNEAFQKLQKRNVHEKR